MAEEATQAPAETQDTPPDSAPEQDTRDTAAPEEGHAATEPPESVDFEKRYNDLRPEFDRTKAELKEAQQAAQVVQALQSDDPQERAWAADILGLELEDGDDDDTPDVDGEFRDPRVDRILEQQERQIAQLEEHIDTTITDLDKQHKTGLDDSEKELIFAHVLSLPPGEDGKPQVGKAFEVFTGILDNRIKKYRESKRDTPSPPVPGGGSGATSVQPEDRKQRLARAMEVADRAFRGSQ